MMSSQRDIGCCNEKIFRVRMHRVHPRFSQLPISYAKGCSLTPAAYTGRYRAAGRFTLDESRVALVRRHSEPGRRAFARGALAGAPDMDIITVTVQMNRCPTCPI